MDEIFISLPLLNKLTELGMQELGTIRKNGLQGAPLKKKGNLQKQPWRSFDFTMANLDGKNLLIALRDSKVVIIGTNYLSCNPFSPVKRFSKAEKKHAQV